MMRKRKYRIIAGTLCTIIMLIAILAPPIGAAAALEGNITILVLNGSADAEDAMGVKFLEAIQRYEDANPNVQIQVEGASQQDILNQFKMAALAGGGADIAMMDISGHAIDLAAMDLLLPITDYITREELVSIYMQVPLNSGRYLGEYYSIPWYIDNCALYYNAERLQSLGIEPPTNWEEFENAIAVVTDAGYGGIISYLSAYAIYAYFFQNGCEVIEASGRIPIVKADCAEGKEAWEYLCGLHTKYNGFVDAYKEATSWDRVYEPFASGEATFLIGGEWCAVGIEKVNPYLDYGILPMPEGKEKATTLGGWTLNINKNTANPALAIDICRYLTSQENDYVLQTIAKAPARIGVDYTDVYAEFPKLQVFAEQMEYAKSRPAIINEYTIDKIITDAFLTVLYDQCTPAEALSEMCAAMRANIAANYNVPSR